MQPSPGIREESEKKNSIKLFFLMFVRPSVCLFVCVRFDRFSPRNYFNYCSFLDKNLKKTQIFFYIIYKNNS